MTNKKNTAKGSKNPHVYFHTNGKTNGEINLFVNFLVTDKKSHCFFMDKNGKYLRQSDVNIWHKIRKNGDPKPVVQKLPKQLIAPAKKISEFISECLEKKVSPTIELWNLRNKPDSSVDPEKQARMEQIRLDAIRQKEERDKAIEKQKQENQIKEKMRKLRLKEIEKQKHEKEEYLKELRADIEKQYSERNPEVKKKTKKPKFLLHISAA